MANFIDLDSIWRDREIYPNENNYELLPQQVETWFKAPRTIRAYPNVGPIEFATTINIRILTLPYTDFLATLPRVYVNFHSRQYNDKNLMYSIDGVQSNSQFVCQFDYIQRDSNGNPIWIHYKSKMEQSMRFLRGDPIVFQVLTRDGSVLPQTDTVVPNPPDPMAQSLCTFELTPFIRDGDYSESAIYT